MIVHASTVAQLIHDRWVGALIFGPSGSGKSDLTLRALGLGWRLVSDDYTVVWDSRSKIFARAPDVLENRIEARGLGIVEFPRRSLCQATLSVKCETGEIDRLPEPEIVRLGAHTLPCVRLNAFEASALDKLVLAMRREL